MYVKQLMREAAPAQPVVSVESLEVFDLELTKANVTLTADFDAIASLESLNDTCNSILAGTASDTEYSPESRMMANYAMLQVAAVTGQDMHGVSMESDPGTVSTEGFKEVKDTIVAAITKLIAVIVAKLKEYANRIMGGHRAIKQNAANLMKELDGLSGTPTEKSFTLNDSTAAGVITGGGVEKADIVKGLKNLSTVGTFVYGEYVDSRVDDLKSATTVFSQSSADGDVVEGRFLLTDQSWNTRESQVKRLGDQELPGGHSMADMTEDGRIKFDKASGVMKTGNKVTTASPTDLRELLKSVISISDQVLAKGDKIGNFNKARSEALKAVGQTKEDKVGKKKMKEAVALTKVNFEESLTQFGTITFQINKAVMSYIKEHVKQYGKKEVAKIEDKSDAKPGTGVAVA